MLRNVILGLLILFQSTAVWSSQGISIDSIYQRIITEKNEEKKVESYLEIITFCRGNFSKECQNIWPKAVDEIKKIKPLEIRDLTNRWAILLINNQALEQADSVLTQNLKASIIAQDSFEWAHTLVLQGWLNNKRGLNVIAVEKYLEALEIRKKRKNKTGILGVYNRLSILYMGINKFKEAKVYCHKIIDANAESGKEIFLSNSYAHLCELYLNQDSIVEAKKYYALAKPLYQKIKKSNRKLYPYYLKCLIDTKVGKLDSAEDQLKLFQAGRDINKAKFNLRSLHIAMADKYGSKNEVLPMSRHLDILKNIPPHPKEYRIVNEINRLQLRYAILVNKPALIQKRYDSLMVSQANYDQILNNNIEKGQLLMTQALSQNEELERLSSFSLKKSQQLRKQIMLFSFLTLFTMLLAYLVYKNRREVKRSKNLLLQLKESNKILNVNIEEKSFLLKEIHHRVKNNLQTISSLLNLQTNHIDDLQGKKALQASMNRVLSIALIHQFLYEKKNLDSVNISKYIESLTNSLLDFFEFPKSSFKIHLNVEPLLIKIETMNSLGLLINELIINVFKYAFEGKESGNIFISLKESNQSLNLIVRDDGVGIGEKYKKENSNSFGYFLIRTLSHKLGGEITIKSNEGTTIELLFNNYKIKRS